jgi:hypothetical protein
MAANDRQADPGWVVLAGVKVHLSWEHLQTCREDMQGWDDMQQVVLSHNVERRYRGVTQSAWIDLMTRIHAELCERICLRIRYDTVRTSSGLDAWLQVLDMELFFSRIEMRIPGNVDLTRSNTSDGELKYDC